VDGTLFTSEAIIENAYRGAIEDFNRGRNHPVHSPVAADILKHVGLPVQNIFDNLFPDLKESEKKTLMDHSLENLISLIKQKKGTLYPGVLSMFRSLGGRAHFAIVSNGRSIYIEAILKTYAVDRFFLPLFSHEGRRNARKSDLVKEYMKKMEVSRANTLMIGDRESDYEGAMGAGTPFLAIQYGHVLEPLILAHPYVLRDSNDFLRVLAEWIEE